MQALGCVREMQWDWILATYKLCDNPEKECDYLDIECFSAKTIEDYKLSKRFFTKKYDDFEVQCIGIKEIGYQRKSVLEKFYDVFENNTA